MHVNLALLQFSIMYFWNTVFQCVFWTLWFELCWPDTRIASSPLTTGDLGNIRSPHRVICENVLDKLLATYIAYIHYNRIFIELGGRLKGMYFSFTGRDGITVSNFTFIATSRILCCIITFMISFKGGQCFY